MKMINAVLREPTREEGVFRKKLDTLFRQVHSVKGEAAALGLSSIESRAHAFEDDLKALKDKPDLSGNDFLPLVIKLDDLLTHLQSVSDLVSRLSRLHVAASGSTSRFAYGHSRDRERRPEAGAKPDSSVTAHAAAAGRAGGRRKSTRKRYCNAWDSTPCRMTTGASSRTSGCKRCATAIVHGIEPPADRLNAGKPTQGQLRLMFQELGDAGYKLIAEDDGQGLSTERIKQAALKKGFITAEKAATLDAKQVFSLLFQPGFSTVETATKDAGRGVGMNLMAGLMQQIGGKVSVATIPGKFTRLTLTLPPVKRAENTEAA